MLVISDRATQQIVDELYKAHRTLLKEQSIYLAALANAYESGGADWAEKSLARVTDKQRDFEQSLNERIEAAWFPLQRLQDWQNDERTITKLFQDGQDSKDFYFVRYAREMTTDGIADPIYDGKILANEVMWQSNGGLINSGSQNSPRWGVHT